MSLPESGSSSDSALLEEVLRQGQESLLRLREAQARLGEVTGRAESPGGLARATADGQADISHLHLDPRALRLGHRELSALVTDVLQAARDAETVLSRVAPAQAEIDEITGTGAGPSGSVSATVDARGRVLGVEFAPRALRLDSRTLAEETITAVRAARADADRRSEAVLHDALGVDPAELRAAYGGLLDARWR
ncbi:YbaB/EbfC family nucleoid-associated protein [Spongiactinospora sp. TRM90649]|uniref:YbaB/EbfC family nucleoid-associated protein n=1 Tax=Spongiactinospora sp. TRM90649 TaxID=3031114 RepID=UPI0023F83408|nr:YbaB/EbfC family nucleoid-associated protein [Spongiactinospora sp. TRM90649]MDF5756042.1 YbaB/EbfC family nucleoid-associated protein [Spongiactinospora sp. TRM90649]